MDNDTERAFKLFAASMTKIMRRLKTVELGLRATNQQLWQIERQVTELERKYSPDDQTGLSAPRHDKAGKPEGAK